jgi:hypothetical protein
MKDLKVTLFSLFVGTLTAVTVWLSIAMTIDPFKTDIITRAAFFASLFLSLTGILCFIILYIGSVMSTKSINKLISNSILQSSLISLLIIIMLILKSLKVLDPVQIIIIFLLFGLGEFALMTYHRNSYE